MVPSKLGIGIERISSGLLTVTQVQEVYLEETKFQRVRTSTSQSQRENTMQQRSGKWFARLSFLFSLLALLGVIVLSTTTGSKALKEFISHSTTMLQEGLHALPSPSYLTIPKCTW